MKVTCASPRVGLGIGGGTPHPNVTLIADLRGLVNLQVETMGDPS